MSEYLEDVCTQPEQLRNTLHFYETSDILVKLNQICRPSFHRLVFSGMGSSHFCAAAASLYLKQHGINSEIISTGELLYYEQSSLDQDTLLVLISQSGESAEIIRLLQTIDNKITVIAVTNDPTSTLARRSRIVLPLLVDPEEAVTTRTYLASVCVTLLFAEIFLSGNSFPMLENLKNAVSILQSVIADHIQITEKLQPFLENCHVVSIMGRGFSLGSVQAGALFFREIVKLPAMDFDEAEFKHGPLEMVEPGFHAIIFAPSGPGAMINCRMAENIVNKGGTVILITDESTSIKERDRLIIVRLKDAEEYLVPVFQIVPVQLAANELAKRRGIQAGKFRWGSKIMSSEV